MRCLPLLGALFLVATSLATAQVQVSVQTERTNFLLYERVDLLVTVENASDSDLILDNNEGHPWLSFLVSRHSHNNYPSVRPERDSNFQPLTLKVGENKTLRVNLTPLFSFREEGDYRASAVIDLPGAGQILSEPVPFTVLKGQVLWSQARPVEGTQRIYSLVRFSPKPDRSLLYLRVEAPDENRVYATLALGELATSSEPDVLFDPKGNLHVLQPLAMGTYLYTRAAPDGKIEHQGIFKSAAVSGVDPGLGLIPPRLAKLDDGNVYVSGGAEQNPLQRREHLSDTQKKATPAAPPPDVAAPDAVAPASAPVPDAVPAPAPVRNAQAPDASP